jgi:hypothetical protein
MAAESGDAQLAELGGALLSRADELSDTGPSTGLDPVLEVLAEYPVTRVGISPFFDDLAGTAGALRYARIAMTASRPDRAPITVFDHDVMAVAAAGAPDVMDRIAANVLGPLDELPDHEREALLDTLEA